MMKTVYDNRKSIATVIAMTKCKWHNRNMFVPEPKEMKGIRRVDDDKREQELVKKIDSDNRSNELHILDFDVDADRADMLITDSLAKTLIKKTDEVVYTEGNSRSIINVDTISDNFSSGDRVDLNSLKAKGLIPAKTRRVKILADGRLSTHGLEIEANSFSLQAIKMITLTGGTAIQKR